MKASQQSMATTRPSGPTLRASSMAVSPKPQPTSSTVSPGLTGRRGSTSALCRDSPPTRMCLNRMNLGASTSFQNWTNSVSSASAAATVASSGVIGTS